jgi:RNA polymerase sigma factor (sigma-70 family)
VEDRKLRQGRLQGMAGSKKTLVERLFAEHGGALKAFFYRRVRRQQEAADLAQEVYLRLLRVPDVDSIRNPEAYLFTVANNLVKEHGLRERHMNAALDIEEPAVQEQLADLPGFGALLDTEARVKRLRQVLKELPTKCQAAVALQYWQGLSYEEIGRQLDISPHMVKKYLSRALAHCRRRMARLG